MIHFWSDKYGPKGYNKLVVLAYITKDVIPNDTPHGYKTYPVMCAIALEQELIKHYKTDHPDSRCANQLNQEGSSCSTPNCNNTQKGVVYVAYKLK